VSGMVSVNMSDHLADVKRKVAGYPLEFGMRPLNLRVFYMARADTAQTDNNPKLYPRLVCY
jgi:hypothetical protein